MCGVGQTDGQAPVAGRMKWVMLLATVALSILTLLTMRYVNRFEVETTQLIQNGTFAGAGNHWEFTGEDGIVFEGGEVTVTNIVSGNRKISQKVEVESPAFYRISLMAEANNVVPSSPEDWALASAVIVSRDELGQLIGINTVARLSGTLPAQHYTENILLTKSVASIDFVARLLRASGSFTVSEPVVSRLRELTTYKYVRATVIFAWVVLVAALGFAALTVLRVTQLVLLIAMAFIALIGTLMPDFMLTELTQKLSGYLPGTFMARTGAILNKLYGGSRGFNDGAITSKLGHLAIFIIIGFFTGSVWRKCGISFALLAIATFAFSTEALQTLVFGRTTSVGDLLVDCIGGLTGLIFGVLVVEILRFLRGPAALDVKT